MCVEPNKIFTPSHYKLNRQSSQEKIGTKKKLIAYYFFVLTIVECGPFEGGAGTNVSNIFLLNRTLLGSSGYFFEIKYLMLNLTKCL